MSLPTLTFGEYLQDRALYVTAADAGVASAWGDDAPKSERLSAVAYSADADTEAARQQALLGQALVVEQHQVKGRLLPYIGRTITLTIDQLGYDAGVEVMVLSASDNLATGMSVVTVLRRL